ncbi:MAG: 3-hydroxyacyl-CoA dehydrogenase/enoyl-CoA hydratase family protein [Gammaproteobacteria bacterium]|nr:3-hydroxyacyl-CoA dehydrogenase/enoyl-CoA hydratase family protein [Gammaproteobacteria bacterium]
MTEKLNIRRAAVLGAGVMGAQIAAHLTNAGVETILFDLPSEKGSQNAIVESSISALSKLKPNPLAVDGIEQYITPANYNTDLDKLRNCDLVIEAISERFDWKQSLYQKVSPYLSKSVIFATNTSGLGIHHLSTILPENLQSRFCGIHFFNPPRYMKLVEIIPHTQTDKSLLAQLETFLVSRLGKGVIIANDTPNFIGNRIGVFSLLAVLHHSRELGLAPDIVDALTGPLIGRSKSATFRTMDVVGLDTMAHVVNTLKQDLKDDPWANYFDLPTWITELIERGALGQKKGQGVYKKVGQQIQVWDYHDKAYRPISSHVSNEVMTIMRQTSPVDRFEKLIKSHDPQAQFMWRIFRDLFHYCAYHLNAIAQSARDIDLSMRWGYGWQQGPFEIWQLASWKEIAKKINQEAQNEETMSPVALPDWVNTLDGPYQQGKAFSPEKKIFIGRSELPIYKRQYFPDQTITETPNEGETIFETDAIRMWTLGDRIPILSFKTKKNCISTDVLEGIQEAILRAEKDYDALVLWQRHDVDFSVGADLKQVVEGLKDNRIDLIEKTVSLFQKTALMLRYASIPTVAAIRGLTLGGGCELSMHTTKIVAAFETYVGLVEVGVGIIPAGAGSKELAYRASLKAVDGNIYKSLRSFFDQVAMGQVSISALDAKRLGYLRPQDSIVFSNDELLFQAKKQALALADISYTPPIPVKFQVAGSPGIANLKTYLVNLREGGFISDHDFLIGSKVAHVLCGGEIEANSLVDEQWMLHLEREAIVDLVQTNETVERIKYMLEKGKPLRN